MNETLSQTLDYLYGLTARGIRPGLERMEKVLALLGDPHRAYPAALVGGTNGKGSTSVMLEAMLREGGLATGLYTSPHVTRFNERIKTGGEEMPDADLVRLVSRIRALVEDNLADADHPTFFEFTTAMAFEHMRERGVEFAVLEVGMGGTWDATNVAAPLVSVITSVSLDHTSHLGGTLGEIAREKAGIIKEGGRVVACVADSEAAAVIEKVAAERNATLYLEGRDFSIRPKGFLFDYYGSGQSMWALSINLKGAHQQRNAACAVKAVEALAESGITVERAAMRRGISKAWLPGRFEIVGKAPVVVLDCAHNPDGARTLAEVLREYARGRLFIVLGIMADKDIEGLAAPLLALAHTVILTSPENERSASTGLLAEKLGDVKGINVLRVEKVGDAVKQALGLAGPADTVCITGSIFTVAEGRGYLLGRQAGREA